MDAPIVEVRHEDEPSAVQQGCRCRSSTSDTGPKRNAGRRWKRRAGRRASSARPAAVRRDPFRAGRVALLAVRACAPPMQLISGTILEASKLPLTRWFLAMQLLTQAKNNVSALELDAPARCELPQAGWSSTRSWRRCGCARIAASSTGAWRWTTPTWVASARGARAGRGSENKVPIVARCRPRRAAAGRGLPAPTTPYRGGRSRVRRDATSPPSATVVSDGLWCFRATT